MSGGRAFQLSHHALYDSPLNPNVADLSFNNISVIEGLDTLTKLTDLSLFNNKIKEIGGLSTLKQLECLSLGNNQLSTTTAVSDSDWIQWIVRCAPPLPGSLGCHTATTHVLRRVFGVLPEDW